MSDFAMTVGVMIGVLITYASKLIYMEREERKWPTLKSK